MSPGADRGACPSCAAPLARAQHYCLECGSRVAPKSPLLAELQHRVRSPAPPGAAEREPGGDALRAANGGLASASPARARYSPIWLLDGLSGLRLPRAPVSAALVLVFLGFGILLGDAASSRVSDTLAASGGPLKLVLPQTQTTASTPTETPPASEPQAPPAETTPEASNTPEAGTAPETSTPAPAAPSTTPAPASSNSGGGQKTGSSKTPSPAAGSTLPPVKHVFVIMLSDAPYASVFGPSSTAPYLSGQLERRGELLVRYYAVAHQQLANGIALLSGQGPTQATASNCATYDDVAPAGAGAEGQVLGEGCVYPTSTQTLATQLTAKHLSWRAYVQGIDEAGATPGACAHPALGAADTSAAGGQEGQAYTTARNPFMYFHSVIDSPACATDDVGLGRLDADLGAAKQTPNFAYIVPDRCHDASPGPCPGGGPGGLPAADSFLKQVVPKILASKAYKSGGLLVITVDEAPSSGEFADSSSCCAQPRFPNLPAPTGLAASLPPEGGGQVGSLLLSPYVKAGTTSQEPYNHFSLLRTIEDFFSLTHLGFAGGSKVTPLEPALFAGAGPH